ncbi:PLP-dependent transferase [Methylorubrum extorquens]
MQPASTRHSHLTPDEPRAVGATDGYVRLAVGLANIDEIRTDLDRALAAAGSGWIAVPFRGRAARSAGQGLPNGVLSIIIELKQ